MDMILAHNPLENLHLEGFTRLADQLARLERYIPFENLIAILPICFAKGFKDKSDLLKAVVLTSLRTIKNCGWRKKS